MICRLCLHESSDIVSIFTSICSNEGNDSYIAHKIMQIATVQVFDGDGLPSLICRVCMEQVESFYQFKIQVEKSDFYLRQQVCSYQTIPLTPVSQAKTPENVKEEPIHALKNGVYLQESIWSETPHSLPPPTTQFTPVPTCEDLSNAITVTTPEEVSTALTVTPESTVFVSVGKEEDKSLLDLTYHEAKQTIGNSKSHSEMLNTNNDSGIDSGRNLREDVTVGLEYGSNFFTQNEILNLGSSNQNRGRYFYSLNLTKDTSSAETTLEQSMIVGNNKDDCEDEGIDGEVVEYETMDDKEGPSVEEAPKPDKTGGLTTTYCEECDKHFETPISLEMHQALHGKKIYECTFCNKSFKHNWYLQSHLRTHTGERPFACSLCPKTFADKGPLNGHMRVAHFSEKTHLCSHCGKGFKLRKHLDRHERIHTGHQYHRCQHCNKLFTQKSNLMKHLVLHTGQKPYPCPVCKKPFAQKDNLNIHIQRHHSQQNPIMCDVCGKLFKNKMTLKGHKKSKHAESTKHAICEVCGKFFTSRSCLNSHKWVHSVGSPETCDVCGKTYPHARAVRVHKRIVHSEVRKYRCDICGVGFKTSQTLKHHKVVHTGERAFSCDECGRSFGQKTALKTHQRIHSGVEPYSCSQCGESFKWKQTRDKHVAKCDGKPSLTSKTNTQSVV